MKLVNTFTLLAIISINALANILPINGVTTGEVSALYDNYFTPAGFTFSIWSVIYLGLVVFVVYQFTSRNFNAESLGYLFLINGLANVSWIVVWHYGYLILSVLIMGVLLFSLIKINEAASSASRFVRLPFQIYLGWVCVATVANIAVCLKYLNVDFPVDEIIFGGAMVVIAGSIGLILLFKKGWAPSTLAIAWGIWGIYNKQKFLEQAQDYQMLCLVVCMLLSVASIAYPIIKLRRQHVQSS
ncbi:MAG: tryptophan-rich sensory protein [Ekhidna sp.]